MFILVTLEGDWGGTHRLPRRLHWFERACSHSWIWPIHLQCFRIVGRRGCHESRDWSSHRHRRWSERASVSVLVKPGTKYVECSSKWQAQTGHKIGCNIISCIRELLCISKFLPILLGRVSDPFAISSRSFDQGRWIPERSRHARVLERIESLFDRSIQSDHSRRPRL